MPLIQGTIGLKRLFFPVKFHFGVLGKSIDHHQSIQCIYTILGKMQGLGVFFLHFFGMGYWPSLSIILMRGRNMAMTMLPTMTARKTIMMGSSREVMAVTALSTSSS